VTRTHIITLAVLAAALPAATAGSFSSSSSLATSKSCFIAGSAGYLISANRRADFTVRIDNSAPHPDLRMQLVDTPADADFVLVDDREAANACAGATSVKRIRVDEGARDPDMTVALSRQAAAYKIYVRSAHYSDADAAALFAAMWQDAGKSAPVRRVAERTP
jgi:fructose-specific component phosphotransferase system IIB-like protein